jgi:hypothetical protein
MIDSMNCRYMETDSNFSAGHVNGDSPAKRSAPSSEVFSDEALFAHLPALEQTLQSLPDSRPEAVARARDLIADPDYPSQHKLQMLAQHLAVQLTDEIDSLPT